MKCSACGNEMGLWAKLTAHSGVAICKECREQADNRLKTLLRSVSGAQSFKLQFAQGWLNEFDETVRKYQMPESTAGPLRLALLNSIFRLVEAEEEMPDSDLKFLVNLGQKYGLGQSATSELRDTIFRVGMKEVIQSWERGEIPRKECSGLVLQKGEVCHWEEGAGLRVQRIKREYVGGYSSVSVPVPLVRGARFRVGGFKGHPIDNTVWEDGGAGVLHITSQRLCFTGQQRSAVIAYKKMISVGGFEGGFIVQTSNEKKPGIFVVLHPELTTQLLTLACNPPEAETSPNKRHKTLPPTA
jgi:hypothetical protein